MSSRASPDEIAAHASEAAQAAMSGCCPLAYGKMVSVLQEALDAVPLMDERYIAVIRTLTSDLLKAQSRDDLYAIADILGYELPWALKTFKKP